MKLPLVGGLAAILACACAPSPKNSGDPITHAYSAEVKACALGVPETHVIDVQDTPDGADVVFTTTAVHLVELRSRVHDQADMHGPDAHLGAGHEGVHGAAQGHGMRLWDMPVQRAKEVDIEGGARLVVVASDPAHVNELRTKVRERVARFDARDCP